MKSIEWFFGLILTWIVLLTLHECYGFRVHGRSSSRSRLTPYDTWLLRTKQYMIDLDQQQQEHKRWLPVSSAIHKRGCKGFPCMYTHMGGSAGNASIKKAKLMLLRECVADPQCFSPGKKRSTENFDRDYNLRRYLMLGKSLLNVPFTVGQLKDILSYSAQDRGPFFLFLYFERNFAIYWNIEWSLKPLSIFREIIQLNIVNMLKSTNAYYWKIILKRSVKMVLYPAKSHR